MLQPNPYPAVSFRTIGGILDFYIYMGPTPENVAQQHVQVWIGVIFCDMVHWLLNDF